MFTQACVKNSVHRRGYIPACNGQGMSTSGSGGCTTPRQTSPGLTHPHGQTPPDTQTPLNTPPRQTSPWHTPPGQTPLTQTPWTHTPPPLQGWSLKWAVSILLKCILVLSYVDISTFVGRQITNIGSKNFGNGELCRKGEVFVGLFPIVPQKKQPWDGGVCSWRFLGVAKWDEVLMYSIKISNRIYLKDVALLAFHINCVFTFNE